MRERDVDRNQVDNKNLLIFILLITNNFYLQLQNPWRLETCKRWQKAILFISICSGICPFDEVIPLVPRAVSCDRTIQHFTCICRYTKTKFYFQNKILKWDHSFRNANYYQKYYHINLFSNFFILCAKRCALRLVLYK